MILLTTIPHTGTQYMQRQLAKGHDGNYVRVTHCDSDSVLEAQSGRFYVITTYRSPVRVAASWGNRDKFSNGQERPDWFHHWSSWADILKGKPLIYRVDEFTGPVANAQVDKYGLHKAIDEKDWDYFYSVVPRRFVTYANKKTGEI